MDTLSRHRSRIAPLLAFTINRLARRRLFAGLIAAATISLITTAPAADVISTWDGSTDVWNNSARWISNPPNQQFPNNGNGGLTYDAILPSGAITLDQDIVIEKLTFSTGTLTDTTAFTLTLNARFTWSGGTMSGSGVTNANGDILIDNAQVVLNGRTLNNGVGSSATLSNFARVFFGDGAVFNNNGTLLAQTNTSFDGFFYNGGATSTFNNSGTFTRNTGTTDFVINPGIVFTNTGTVNVQSGLLSLGGGDGGNTSGAFDVSSGATLNFASNFDLAAASSLGGAGNVNFSSGTIDIAGTYDLTGTSSFSGATVNFNSVISSLESGLLDISSGAVNFNANGITVSSPINLSGGTLGGSGTFNSSGLFTWIGGTMSGSGVTNANGDILIDNAQVVLNGRTLNNGAGSSATLSNFARVFFGNGAVFNNNGTLLAQTNTSFDGFFYNGGATSTFNNSGTFTRNTGTTDFVINPGIVFTNTGTVNVQSGLLSLGGGDGGNTSGAFDVSSGATLNFASNFDLAAASSLGGAGNVNFSSGTIDIAGTYDLTGTSSFSGATVNFNSAINSLGTGPLNISSGAVNFNANGITVSSPINLSGGTLGGSGTFNSSGLFTWSGGTINGINTVQAKGGILINNAQVVLDGRTLNNAAGSNATLSNFARVFFGNGAVFNNNGTLLAQTNTIFDGFFYNGGATSTFNNSGTFTRDTGPTDFVINSGIVFNNTGTVNVQSGSLSLRGGDGGNTTGAFSVSSGATLRFQSDFSLAASSSIGGAGVAEFSSGTVNVLSSSISNILIDGGSANFIPETTVASLALTGGTLGGSGTFTSSGLFTWSGGTINGITTLQANGGILIDNFQVLLDGRTLNNGAGSSATLSNFVRVFFQNSAVFNNAGTLLAQTNTNFDGFFPQGGGGTFNNSGTFTRNVGTTDFSINSGIVFNNTGIVNVQSGSLSFYNGGDITGNFNVSTGATLHFNSAFNLPGSTNIGGAGVVLIDGGTIGGSGTLTTSAQLTWLGGTMSGSGVTDANGGILIDNAQPLLDGRILNNGAGSSATLSNFVRVFFQDSAVFNNAGTLLAQTNTNFDGFFPQGGGGTFNNSGTFTRNVGTTDFSINSGIVFNNTGIVNVQSGSLSFYNGGDITGNFNVSTGATLHFNSAFNLPGSTNIGGAGVVLIDGGTIGGSGTLTTSAQLTWLGGTMSGSGVTNANGGILIDNAQPLLDGRILNNGAGSSATLSNFARVFFQNSAVFNNTGILLAQTNTNFDGFFPQGGGGTFNNSGTFTRNVGTTDFSINSGIAFNNTGTVNVQSGSLSLYGGGNIAGDFNVSSGATLRFRSDLNCTASGNIAGAGVVLMDGGTLTGPGTLTASALLTWTGGTMSGNGVTNANGGMLIDNAQVLLDGRTLNNGAGSSATLSNFARVFFQNSAVFNNAGTLLAQTNTNFDGFFPQGGGGTFNNSGTFTRNTGTTDFAINSGIVFNNTGTVNADSGTISFNGGYTQTAGVLSLFGGSVSASTPLVVQGGQVVGNGMISGSLNNSGGTISPGFSLGNLTITGTLSFGNTSTYQCELNSSTARNFEGSALADQIVANGVSIVSGSTLSLTDLGSGTLPLSTVLVVIDNTSNEAIVGRFTNLDDDAIIALNGNTFQASYVGGTGNDLTLTVVAATPTPTPTASPTPTPTPTPTVTPTPAATPTPTVTPTPTCVPPPSGMISWWPGDGNANDIQDGNNGTLQNGTTFVQGEVGLGFKFDGVDALVNIPDAPNLDSTTATWDFWLQTTQTSANIGLIAKHDQTGSAHGFIVRLIPQGHVGIEIKNDFNGQASEIHSNTAVNDGQFHHIAVSYQSGGTTTFYVDGVAEASGPTLTFTFNQTPVRFGRPLDPFWGPLNGILDEVELFDRILAPSEIQAIYNAGSAGKCKPISTPTPTPTPITISGNISYCSNPVPGPVPNVTLTLTGSSSDSTTTDGLGNYTFSALAAGGSYIVTPTKNALPPGSTGIDTFDAMAVQGEYLNRPIPPGCQRDAADVNGDNRIDTFDVVAIQRFYVGRPFGTANVGKYKFTPVNRSYPGLGSNQTDQNYDTLVLGDVVAGFVHRPEGTSQNATDDVSTSTSTLSGLNTSASEVPAPVATLSLPNVAVDAFVTNFILQATTTTINAKNKLVGFQGDFTFDERVITFQSDPVRKAGMTSDNWSVLGNVLPGKGPIRTLRISAYSADFTPLSGEGTLFELRIRTVSDSALRIPNSAFSLLWAAPPNHFTFIDADLNPQKPGNAAPGSVTPSISSAGRGR